MRPSGTATWRRIAFALALLLPPALLQAADATGAAAPNPAERTSTCGPLRPQDQFWVVGTTHLDCVTATPAQPPELSFQRYDCQSGWRIETSSALLNNATTAITVFYIPGNRVANEEAVSRGWILYHSLIPASDEEPLRLVVWSWPSERVSHSLGKRDFQVKAARTPTESVYLGGLLNQFDPAAKISLVGFSYGARIITGALHVAAGGELHGVRLPGDPTSHAERRMRVVLMSAALHNYWLQPGELHGNATSQVDRMLVLFNTNDVALKNYHLIEDDGDPRALGYTGLETDCLVPAAARVAQRDVRNEIGKAHAELRYYCSGQVISELQLYALWGSVAK